MWTVLKHDYTRNHCYRNHTKLVFRLRHRHKGLNLDVSMVNNQPLKLTDFAGFGPASREQDGKKAFQDHIKHTMFPRDIHIVE